MHYSTRSPFDTQDHLRALKTELAHELAILGHHYQLDDVLEHADVVGDSLELAKRIPGLSNRKIVFCGVRFMAETAAVLAKPDQRVFVPAESADCVMARMAPTDLLEKVLTALNPDGPGRVVPLAYVNTSAKAKAICARFKGSVCTSANAERMLRWAFAQGEQVLFLPDKHLGLNTARAIGLEPGRDIRILDIRASGAHVNQGSVAGRRLLLWPGQCAVHARFTPERLEQCLERFPDAMILAHPECRPEIVERAHGVGSTASLIRAVADAPADRTILVATEYNLVRRLALRHPHKRILPLTQTSCSGMARSTPRSLMHLLEHLRLDPDVVPSVRVDEDVRESAFTALERMLTACA